jgi:twitching motility protein PilT
MAGQSGGAGSGGAGAQGSGSGWGSSAGGAGAQGSAGAGAGAQGAGSSGPVGSAGANGGATGTAVVDGRGTAPEQALSLRALLEEMMKRGASDLHITAGEKPKLRIDGKLVDAGFDRSLAPKDTLQVVYSVLTDTQKKRFETEDDLDFSFGIQNLARFRGNAYRQRGCAAMAIRLIPFNIRSFDDLKLPPIVAQLAERPRGLVLVTGPTGSGKSTTLAAMIDKINREERGHILTIEDPIEFVHRHQGCIVNQREVGGDTKTFSTALKYALRQDPDVVLIGEMRDLETISAALTIAETGHLAFGTLHTNSAAESINRIIDVFPSHQQSQVRAQLGFVLEGVVTQTLVPKARGGGRVCAAEIMVCTPAIRACIRDDKIHQITSIMQAGKKFGMQTMNDALNQLCIAGQITLEEAVKHTSDPNELLRMAGQRPA